MKKLYYNGKIVSMDDAGRTYSAIGMEEEKIIFLGNDAEALALDWDEKENLQGYLVLPAFTDTHLHVLHYAMLQKELSLYGVDSLEKMIEMGKAQAAKGGEYVFGMGWNQEAFAHPVFPTKDDLNQISTDIPVILLRACGHIAVVNSRALELIKEISMPKDVRENVDFETGHLKESAMRLYMELIPKRDGAYIKSLFLSAQNILNSCGITGVHSDDLASIPGTDWRDVIKAYTELDRENLMTVRVHEQCLVFGDPEEFHLFAEETKDMRKRPGKFFEIGPRKLLQDGSLGAKSACMIHGYLDDPDNHGLPTYTKEELYTWIKAADDADMDVAVHAIGDLAVKDVLDALEGVIGQSKRTNHRHGIVHVQFITQEDMQRMARLGIQAYIQPIFLNSDVAIIDERIPSEYQFEGYAWKSMQESGILTSGGSDCPVEFFDPLKNIYAAVERKSLKGGKAFRPEENLSVEDAVRLFTSQAAKAGGHENDRGILQEGYLADFTVIDTDIFACEPEAIKNARVIKTVAGGKEVYCQSVPI